MRTLPLLIAFALTGCVASEIETDTTAGVSDSRDPDAAFDGFYVLNEASILDEDYPLIRELDLRPDQTYYSTESALSPDDPDGYNWSVGWSPTSGTVRYTKSTTGRKFMRFSDGKGHRWGWEYRVANDQLEFLYRNGDGGFTMSAKPAPSSEWVDAIFAKVDGVDANTLADFTEVDHYDDETVGPVRDSALDLRDAKFATIRRVSSNNRYAYLVGPSAAGDYRLFARSGHLLGTATTDGTMPVWTRIR